MHNTLIARVRKSGCFHHNNNNDFINVSVISVRNTVIASISYLSSYLSFKMIYKQPSYVVFC